MKVTTWVESVLACPRTHAPLEPVTLPKLGSLRPIGRDGFQAHQFGATEYLLTTQNRDRAYPVVDGFPALLWPEALFQAPHEQRVDLRDQRYHEGYSEMKFYNPVAYEDAAHVARLPGYRKTRQLLASRVPSDLFPEPTHEWIEPCFDIEAKVDCSRYIAPVRGRTVLQLGGHGGDAIRLLAA
jgi:uncharacterized protein YbaR (Trm112 family)